LEKDEEKEIMIGIGKRIVDFETFIKESGISAGAEMVLQAQSKDIIATILEEGVLTGQDTSLLLISRINQLREVEDVDERKQGMGLAEKLGIPEGSATSTSLVAETSPPEMPGPQRHGSRPPQRKHPGG